MPWQSFQRHIEWLRNWWKIIPAEGLYPDRRGAKNWRASVIGYIILETIKNHRKFRKNNSNVIACEINGDDRVFIKKSKWRNISYKN
jgi:hypothetical protein